MSAIWYAIVRSYAFLATIPVIPFLIVYLFSSFNGKDRKSSIRLAMDVSNAFLLGCVAYLINSRLHTSFGLFFLILLLLIGGGLIGNAQNRLKGKVDTSKLIRAVWRLSFFGLAVLYILFMLLELISPTVSK